MSTTGWIIFFLCIFVFSLVVYKWKDIKAYFSKMFKSSGKGKNSKSSKKNKKGDKEKSSKLKSSNNQTRPVVKPPEEKNGDSKKVEVKPDNQGSAQNSVIDAKPIDYKLSSTATKKQDNKALLNLKDDLDKEFEDIRKYLNMPEPINLNNSNVKKVPGNQIASPFAADDFKSNVGKFNPYSASNFVKGVGRAGSTASEGKFPYNSRGSAGGASKGGYKSVEIESSKNMPVNNFNPSLNFKNANQNVPYSNFKPQKSVENKVVIDGEEIDLNKLPLNIKRLIVSNILARKNYDD